MQSPGACQDKIGPPLKEPSSHAYLLTKMYCHSHRSLMQQHKYLFFDKNGFFPGSIRANSASVETFWSHTIPDWYLLYSCHNESHLGHGSWLESCFRIIHQGGPAGDLARETLREYSAFAQWAHWSLTSTHGCIPLSVPCHGYWSAHRRVKCYFSLSGMFFEKGLSPRSIFPAMPVNHK